VKLVHRWLLAAFIGIGAIVAPAAIASAQDTVEVTDTVASIQLNAITVSAIVSLFIPVLVGLLTKSSLNSVWKGALNVVLSAVNAAVVTATVADGTAVFSKETLVTTFFAMVVSLATYLQIYKPVNIDQKLAPEKGLG